MHNFKKALQTSFLFLLIFSILSVSVMEVYFSSEDYYFQDCTERSELAGQLDYLLVGASHCEREFVPDIIDEDLDVNCYNLAGPELTMWARYDLLKLELSRNPVKTVVLEVSYDSVRSMRAGFEMEGDCYYMGRIYSFTDRVRYFFKSFRLKDYFKAYQFFINYGMNSLKRIYQGKFKKVYYGNRVKGYKPYDTDDATDVSLNYVKKFKTKEYDPTVDEKNVFYLQKIVALCKENNVRLIMVTTPVSTANICRLTSFDDIHNYYVSFAEENDLEYYDFNLIKNRDELFSDKDSFKDETHLNNGAAIVFTTLFCDYMKDVDSGEDISYRFFDSYEDYEKTQDYYEEAITKVS